MTDSHVIRQRWSGTLLLCGIGKGTAKAVPRDVLDQTNILHLLVKKNRGGYKPRQNFTVEDVSARFMNTRRFLLPLRSRKANHLPIQSSLAL